ncbi:hypothetical protein CS542_06365 [Pedobacter sp. IW39]|nr:hypothetical protein CS542_06365 [Pedobacter sp. IW39]
MMPGIAGVLAGRCCFDPETGMFYVPSNTIPYTVRLENHKHLVLAIMENCCYGNSGWYSTLEPPYGRLTAIDMHTGEHNG